uniref:(northern house mosquito) hypothetical protein n=2 Tax=Culex pipiens TaxID=7175 RepID=A0A8D8CLC6_CULPI
MGPIENIVNMYGFYEVVSQVLVEEDALKQLLKYHQTFRFDLVVHEFMMGQFLLGFVGRFGYPPLVSVSAFNAPSYTAQLTGGPVRTSTLPNYAACFGQRMTLLERAWNTFYFGTRFTIDSTGLNRTKISGFASCLDQTQPA